MKLLLLISLGCYIVACIHFTTATPYANADPKADPDPLVGKKLKKTCESSMGNTTSHKVLCEKATDHVVSKISKVCHKAIKYGCKMASFAIKYQKCYDKLKSLMCPAEKPPVVKIEGDSKSTMTDTPTSHDQHSSKIRRLIMKQCDNYLQSIVDDITENGQQLTTTAFCKELGLQGRHACVASLTGQCELLRKGNWAKVKGICKNYIVPWICK